MRWVAAGAASLGVLLGIAFTFAGGLKLNDPGAAVGLFASWGLPAWTVTGAGWTEVALGALLFRRPTRRWGAALLCVWMLAFGLLQLRAGQAGAAGASAAVLVAAAWVGARSPRPPGGGSWLPTPLRSPPIGPTAILRTIELVGVSFLFRWAIGGTLFWTALGGLAWSHSRREGSRYVEALLLHLLVLGLGTSGLWAFIGHTFLADTVSVSVGWSPSPFQQELAAYHLGVGAAGLACWWIRDRFWLATGLIPTVFLYGAGAVHLHDYVTSGNAAPANWGLSVLFGNLLIPSLLLMLLVLRERRHVAADAAVRPDPAR